MNELERALDAELTRLLALGLSPEEEEIARRYYSQKERESMDEGAFCGPHKSFPITNQADVSNAAHLIGHADNPEAVKRCIIGKAHKNGWKLPASWEEDKKETSDNPVLMRTDVPVSKEGSHEKTTGSHDHKHPAYGDQGDDDTHGHSHSHDGDNDHHHGHSSTKKADTPDIVRAADVSVDKDGSHEKTSGSHSHHHPAFGADDGGEDGQHSHDHEHSNDNNHKHSHADVEKSDTPEIVRSMPGETTIFAPILRIDQSKREVVVRATAEDLDTYQTVISFDGSKDAFARWRGNIREMHDATRAVGRALKWDPIEEEKAIDLTLRVSRGAEDTWQKVLDGTLSGASIGARNGKWGKRQWKGKEVPYLERYDLVEVSLVDNPSCPGCDVKIVRMDGATLEATDILDFSEEPVVPPTPAVAADESIERRGARVATNTMSSMHKSRDHALQGIRETLSNCSCDECQGALRVLDPDGDGDIDIVSSLDTDKDRGGAGAAAGDGSGVMKSVEAEITRQLAPTIQRMNGIAARLASVPSGTAALSDELMNQLQFLSHEIQKPLVHPDMIQRMDTLEQKFSELDEVRASLETVKGLVERMAAQPMPGGPIVNSAVARTAGADYQAQPDMLALEAEVIARLARSGILTKDQQVNAAIYLQRQGQQAAARR